MYFENDLIVAREKHKKQLRAAQNACAVNNHKKAEKLYRAYLESVPLDPAVCFNMGTLIQQRAKTSEDAMEAAQFYERAICSPYAATYQKAGALNNLGLMMLKAERPDKALIAFRMALGMNPEMAEAKVNYAETLLLECRYEEADKEFTELLKMHPHSPEGHLNTAMLRLVMGDMETGWDEYEWRFSCRNLGTPPFTAAKPLWRGEDLQGKVILMTMEQGFGDVIQFSRYAKLLKERGARVWFYGQTLIVPLIAGVDGVELAFDRADSEEFDYHVPIMSLPHRFGTRLDSIPSPGRYIHAQPDWKPFTGLGEKTKPRIGIVWAGSPRHGKDAFRSIQPEMFQQLIDLRPDVEWVSFQIGPRDHEVKRLRNVVDLAPHVSTWTDSYFALDQVDLLISVDTATVHLAGAMNRPVWMLTPSSPDFRWMLGRTDSPWYPSLRLFRQERRLEWQPVFDQIKPHLLSWKPSQNS